MSLPAQIIAARKADPSKNPATIGAELGTSRQWVSRVLKANGLPSDFRGIIPAKPKPKPKKVAPLSPFGQAMRLLDLDNEATADQIGAHSVTVSKYAHGAIEAPETAQLLLLAMLGLGRENVLAGIREGQRKLKAAVDTKQQAAKI